MDLRIHHALLQAIAHHEIVDAPPCVLLARLETVAPPRIRHLLRILPSERIRKATGQQVAELLALLVGKAGIHAVALGVLQVDLLVGHVQVATEDHGFLGVEALQVTAEGILPRHAILQALQSVLRVRRITADKEEILHLERHHAPLMVVHIDADAIRHAQGLVLREDGRTRVALLLGIVPVALIALKLQVKLSGLHLRLLQAEEVGIQFTEDVTKPLAFTSPQAIHVPTHKFHTLSSYFGRKVTNLFLFFVSLQQKCIINKQKPLL